MDQVVGFVGFRVQGLGFRVPDLGFRGPSCVFPRLCSGHMWGEILTASKYYCIFYLWLYGVLKLDHPCLGTHSSELLLLPMNLHHVKDEYRVPSRILAASSVSSTFPKKRHVPQ